LLEKVLKNDLHNVWTRRRNLEKMVDDGEKDKYLTGKMERERQKTRQNPPIFQKSYKNGGNL